MPAEISLATPIRASGHRPRIAIALEYPLMQQGGTEVLVRELLRRLSGGFELLLVSGDSNANELPPEFQKLICGHFSWDQRHARPETGRQLAENLYHQNIQLAHFHFGGACEWRSSRLLQCPVY